jgi:hypothetical protein
VPSSAGTPGTKAQQEFISTVAPGAIAAQQRWGVPAAVTIAQAIEESNWGSSELAAKDHNLFGIKGTGPAGTADYPTQEYTGGQWVTITAGFRAYHNIAESVSDHAELLATSGYYIRAMADRAVPDAFANDLTGVYATDPSYGTNLIALMHLYDLYRYDTPGTSTSTSTSTTSCNQQVTPSAHSTPAAHSTHFASPSQPAASSHSTAPAHAAAPVPSATPLPAGTTLPAGTVSPGPAPSASPTATTAAPKPGTSAPQPNGASQQNGAAQKNTANIPGLGAAPLVSARTAARYTTPLPATVATAYFTTVKTPLSRSEQLYRDVASQCGISWKLLAAVDWMQCQANPRYSPVHGEKLGTVNRDGSVYATRSEALTQCATDMISLASAVYGTDLTVPRPMSVRTLAEVFAAFRWGGLLKKHGISAMEFPYSVAGLTESHNKMTWPAIPAKNAPDKPGSKFKQGFGAVPVVLSLKYPATV